MEHHRCAHCRNPIRRGPGVEISSETGEPSWFHRDCWVTVLDGQTQKYRRSVEELGVAALVAPYAASRRNARLA